MTQATPNMRNFTLMWSGQTMSLLGSKMTNYGAALWVFEQTGQVTSLALVGLSSAVPRLITHLFGGSLIDRFNRKKLIFYCDLVAALVTVSYLLLLISGQLQIWHLYLGSAILGPFDTLQGMAENTAITTMVDKKNYVRAMSMNWMTWYGTSIFASPIASVIYPVSGLLGVMIVDLITFGYAVLTLLIVKIPQPELEKSTQTTSHIQKILSDLKLGFQFAWSHTGLRAFWIVQIIFMFFHDFNVALNLPMILARTNHDGTAVAAWAASAGLGGLIAAIIMSWKGGMRDQTRMYGWFTIGAGIGKVLVGLSQTVTAWMPTQFFTSFNFPFRGTGYNTTFRLNTPANMQGRVFAINELVVSLFAFIGMGIAGPLADHVFEPAFRTESPLSQMFGGIFGTGPGAGMAFLFVIGALGMIFSGVLALVWKPVQALHSIPESDVPPPIEESAGETEAVVPTQEN